MKKLALILAIAALSTPSFAAEEKKSEAAKAPVKTEEKKVETPKAEPAKAEAPKAEAPKTEATPAPATEAPVTIDTSSAEALLNTPTPYDVVYGDLKAPVKIVEFGSLSCPHCAHFNKDVKPTIIKKYIETGKASLVLKPYPLNPPALRATLLVGCTKDNAKRQAFVDALFASIESWAYPKNPATADAETKIKLIKIGKMGGVDEKSADACINDTAKEKGIIEVIKQGKDLLKIDSTPTFFINGVKMEGEKTIDVMSKAIEAAK